MHGNGPKTVGTTAMLGRRPMAPLGCREIVASTFFAVGPGAAFQAACGRRAVSRPTTSTEQVSLVFASLGRLPKWRPRRTAVRRVFGSQAVDLQARPVAASRASAWPGAARRARSLSHGSDSD